MLRVLALIFSMLLLSFASRGSELSVTVGQADAAIEQARVSMDSAEPGREELLKTYRDTRALLLDIDKHKDLLETFSDARANAFEDADSLRNELESLQGAQAELPDDSVGLAELEQMIQLDRSGLGVLKNHRDEVTAQKDSETGRPSSIRSRLAELGAQKLDLEANLKLTSKPAAAGGMGEAQLWLAQASYESNRAEKASLEEELLSQPMRLDLLAAQEAEITARIKALEANLLAIEERASDMREGEAQKVLAAAETAQTEALGKHQLVRDLADRNTSFSASLAERGVAIEGFRQQELRFRAQAEDFERELKTIERKLEILGMTKTVGEILREQQVRLPSSKTTERDIAAIAELIGSSSLRQMELQDELRAMSDIQVFVDAKLAVEDVDIAASVKEDMLELALNRQQLANRAVEVERIYDRALTDLDASVHRRADAVDKYRLLISERLLWVQSRDSLSWSLFTDLPGQLAETFAPGRWREVVSWMVIGVFGGPLTIMLLALVASLIYLEPQIKQRLLATGHSVGVVRTDSIADTLKALTYSLILMLKWPLLMLAIALPLEHREADSILASALNLALARTALYLLGLEFIRCLLIPGGLVASHFRWPAQRVANLSRRVRRFETIFLTSVFIAIFFVNLYPTDVGGSVGTIAVVTILISMTQFFYRMPHFVKSKMDLFFAEPATSIHSVWGTAVRGLLAWAPVAMIIAVLFGYTYTVIEFSMLLIQTIVLFTAMLLMHELGMRWLRITRRRLRLKVQSELAQSQNSATEESDFNIEEDILEHDPELLNDEGTKFLNALLLLGSVVGIALIWSDVFPALGILDSVHLWQSTDSLNGQDVIVQVTLGDLIAAVLTGLVGWILIRRLPNLLEILLRQRMEVRAASAYAFATVVKYLLTIFVVIAVLSMLGGSWSQIQWAVAALSLGIGFGLQEIVANFFSGLIILFEQPIRVGDTVTVGDTSGVVTKIQMRATTIRDWDRRELLVPNKEFVTGRLLNWSLTDPITRLQIEVGVSYGSDMDEALEIVRQAALSHILILDDPAPFVTFDEFGDNSLVIILRCYLEELDKRLSTASAIRLEINRNLIEAGISVAFPQRDVHLDSSSPLDIRLVDQKGGKLSTDH